jgi:hypothetical protein
MAVSKVQKYIAGGVMYILLFAGGSEVIGGNDNDNICGGEDRWQQKVLIDKEAATINTKEILTTIDSLTAINTTIPANKFGNNKPRMNIEKQVYTLRNVYISDALRENDNDLHLVIEDGKGHHMIAEIPDPTCPDAKKSDWSGEIEQSRNEMLKHANNYRHFLFTVTGVLFVDKAHGQTGRADNNVEIHPILKLHTEKQINPVLK